LFLGSASGVDKTLQSTGSLGIKSTEHGLPPETSNSTRALYLHG